MATDKIPRKRKSKSTRIRHKTSAAHEQGQLLIDRLTKDPALRQLSAYPEASSMLEQLRQNVAILAAASTMRIGAARRLQGATSRRRTTAQALFDACAEVRRRIKGRYRGGRHVALRRAFGEGMIASPAKPETVVLFAEQILRSADMHVDELREVRIGPPTLHRMANLKKGLLSYSPERAELRTARQQMGDDLIQIAARVTDLCDGISSLARRICQVSNLD